MKKLLIGISAAALLCAQPAAASFATSGKTASAPTSILGSILEISGLSFSFFGSKAGSEAETPSYKNDGDDQCTEATIEKDGKDGVAEEAEASGPEPLYFGF